MVRDDVLQMGTRRPLAAAQSAGGPQCEPGTGAETALFWEPFLYSNDQFTKTGSGPTYGKVEGNGRFLAGGEADPAGVR